MVTSLRKTAVLIVMALVMLASLFGWALRTEASSLAPHSGAIYALHTVAHICPPPPYDCMGD
jgi:hypothetical protein